MNAFIKFLRESDEKKGSYAAVKFSDKTNEEIINFIIKSSIPNSVDIKDIHCTLLYSTKYCPDLKLDYKLYEEAMPLEFTVFNSRNGKNFLVLKLESEFLKKRHNDLMKTHEATYDFPEYIPHITLSTDCGDFDVTKLNVSDLPGVFEINYEYSEDLNLNWGE